MNDELRQAFGKYLVARGNTIQAEQKEREEIDNLLNVLGKPYTEETEKPTEEEILSLKSDERTSDKGPYRLINKAENSGNAVFEKLRSYIAEKGGFCQIYGFKAWIFSNDPENKIGFRHA